MEKNEGLFKQGEELYQRFLRAEAKATEAQREQARQVVGAHIMEYEHSYAAELIRIVEES